MRYWSDIKDKLDSHIDVASNLLLLLVGAYIFIMAEKHSLLKVPVLFVGLFSWFFLRNKTKHPIIWIVLFLLLVFDLYHFYFRVANHHFVLTFVVLSVIIYIYHKSIATLLKNIQMIVVVVLITSALQKLMTSQFMSGDFYYYLMNRGYVFNVFLTFFSESLEIAKSNSDSIIALQATDPNIAKSIVLKDIFPNLGSICIFYAWITVAVEFIVAIALLLKPRSKWTHFLFITMIIGILCTRLEMGFMALLAICGLYLCNSIKLRLLYVMIVMGCIAFIIARIGYY